MSDTLTVISCAAPPESVDALFELLDAEAFTPTSCLDVETRQCRVSVFLEDPAQATAVAAELIRAGDLCGLALAPETDTLARADWAEAWKRFFHIERVSERIIIRPSWEVYDAKHGERVITLDPGLSFGTGKHATTQSCLRLLDRLAAEAPGRSVLDMGTGTGILAIAAALLGFPDVRAFDNDPGCMAVAQENARANGLTLPFAVDDLTHVHPPADIVVANILAPVLIQFAPEVAGSMSQAPRARLILSGILDEQYAAVKTAYEAQGLVEEESLLAGEWRTGLFARET